MVSRMIRKGILVLSSLTVVFVHAFAQDPCPSLQVTCASCSTPAYTNCWESGTYSYYVIAQSITNVICNRRTETWCDYAGGVFPCFGVDVAAFYVCESEQSSSYYLLCCEGA
jgi:hypothetical protein